MANKYGFDLETMSNPTLPPPQSPEFRNGPDDWELYKRQNQMAEIERYQNQAAFGDWLMSLPFTFAPNRQQVLFQPTHGALAAAEPAINGIIENSISTPKSTAAMVYSYPEIKATNYGPRDLNMPTGPLFENFFPNLPPEKKIDITMRGIELAAKLGSTLAPEILKDRLPPKWRALGHYLAGSGKVSDVNLKESDFPGDALDDTPVTTSTRAHALATLQEHPVLKKYLDQELPYGVGAETTAENIVKNPDWDPTDHDKIFPTLGKYFVHPNAFIDDYRFYDLGISSLGAGAPTSTTRQWTALKEALKGTRTLDIEAVLSHYGKPFPVIVPRSK